MRHFFLLAFASAFLPGRAAGAQQPSQDLLGLDSAAFAQLQARVNAQNRVRVGTRSGQPLIITRPYLTANNLGTYGTSRSSESTMVDLGQVSVIEVRGSSAGTGAMVGAGIGAVSGFFAGMALGEAVGCCTQPTTDQLLFAGAIVGFGGAAIGALLGAGIGAQIKKWKTVYRAKPRARSAHMLFTPHSRGGLMLAASVSF